MQCGTALKPFLRSLLVSARMLVSARVAYLREHSSDPQALVRSSGAMRAWERSHRWFNRSAG
jgi:hypothetical protein